jgi:hypothetical protein
MGIYTPKNAGKKCIAEAYGSYLRMLKSKAPEPIQVRGGSWFPAATLSQEPNGIYNG